MITVLEKGNKNKFRVKCGWCDSILEYFDSDTHCSYNLYDDSATEIIKCPVCNRMVITHMVINDKIFDYRIKD